MKRCASTSRSQAPAWERAAQAIVLLAMTATAAVAQDVQVAVQDPPYYVDEPVIVRLVVRGLEEQPEPTCQASASSSDLRARIASIQPNVSRSMSIVTDPLTGRQGVKETTSVVYVIDYQVTTGVAGDYTLGPFSISQGHAKLQAKAVSLTFQAAPSDPDMRVRLLLPSKPLYPDQRVPVTIEWWYAGDFDAIHKLQIHSPLFDQFSFAPDAEPGRRANVLPIETKDGQVALPAQVRRETADGRTFTVLSAVRTLIPDRPGEHSWKPITATLRRVTQGARTRSPFDDFGFGSSLFDDLMGDRKRAAKTALVRAVGEPTTLVVKPFPVEQRPQSFAGAVGSGFSIDVAADRTVVRVGDPITLTVTLRGTGNIDNASLPSLAADGGMNPDLFRLPEGEISGTSENGAKRFQVSVRVKDDKVSEIPAVAYSWFDPAEEKYGTTRSKPIALRVMPATIVSAQDVISAAPKKAQDVHDRAASPATGQTVAGGQYRPSFSLTGADLSVERDMDKLLCDGSRPFGGAVFQASLYVAGLLVLVVAVVDRKRKDVPQEIVARRKALREQRSRIDRARHMPPRQAAEQIAGALRSLLAIRSDVARESVQQVVQRCESVVYAPGPADSTSVDMSLVTEALAVADQFIKEAE